MQKIMYNQEKRKDKRMRTSEEIRERADELLSRMTLKEKLNIIVETSPANERLGIPEYRHGNEALHGVVRPGTYTVFPQAIALGAMFDDDLLYRIADAISTESRARYHNKCADGLDEREFYGRYNGLLSFWSPDLNISRDPRWGRTAETYGEDPYLAGKCGTAFVRGIQGNDKNYLKAIATPKHFTANNEEHNRFECNAVMSERSLREYYLEPFRMTVRDAEPEAIMGAYNAINGIPCHENSYLLKDILRGEWGFDGYVVSDCSAIARLWDHHKRYDNPSDASAAALNGGVDLECGGYSFCEHFYVTFLEEQIAKGKVTEDRVDEAARRVLCARIKTGQFDDETNLPWSGLTLDVIGCEKHSALSYEAAVKSAVLLKNDGILPVSNNKKILVVGNNADKCQFGDYSGKAKNKPVSPYEGIKKHCPGAKLIKWNYIKASSEFRTVPAFCYFTEENKPGISASFYKTPDRSGLPQTRTDEAVDYEWLARYPDPLITTTEFSCVFKGFVKAPLSGEYRFRVSAGGHAECTPPELFLCGEKYDGETVKVKAGDMLPFVITYSKQLDNPFVRLEWTTPSEIDENELFTEETAAAAEADVIIAVLGLGTEYECEGRDKTDLDLPNEQILLLEKLAKVNSRIVLVTENGSALTLKRPAELSAAVLEAWYPGDRGGDAIADILFGKVSPSGRLPLSFPESVTDLPAFDDYIIENKRTYMYAQKKPLYPFGYGLSYTQFEYIAIRRDGDTVIASVMNTGGYESDEVVQMYIDSCGKPGQPKYKLAGFSRIHLKPGETGTVYFRLTEDSFARYDDNGQRTVFSGDYTAYVGGGLPDDSSVSIVIRK